MKPKIQKISIPGLSINARVWGPENGQPILAMHGWLDNAASFDLLAPLMPDFKIVSVDFPGHGFSDPLPLSGIYEHRDRIIQMMQVVDSLGWDRFSIIGHSMGGIIGSFIAGVLPERVEKIACIDIILDALLYVSMHNKDIISAYRNYYRKSKKVVSDHRVYESYAEAARVRLETNKLFPMKQSSVETLAEGGMKKVSGGYSWTFDLRLLLPSILMFTEEAITDILKNITSPMCIIIGEDGLVKKRLDYTQQLSHFNSVELHELPGGHHLHMDYPESVAKILNEFFS